MYVCECNVSEVRCTLRQKIGLIDGRPAKIILFFSYRYDQKKSVMENCLQLQDYADKLSAEEDTLKETWIMHRILSI